MEKVLRKHQSRASEKKLFLLIGLCAWLPCRGPTYMSAVTDLSLHARRMEAR